MRVSRFCCTSDHFLSLPAPPTLPYLFILSCMLSPLLPPANPPILSHPSPLPTQPDPWVAPDPLHLPCHLLVVHSWVHWLEAVFKLKALFVSSKNEHPANRRAVLCLQVVSCYSMILTRHKIRPSSRKAVVPASPVSGESGVMLEHGPPQKC